MLAFAGLDAQAVVDLADAGEILEGVLGDPLLAPAVDGAFEGDLAVLDPHLDVGGVDVAVAGQQVADVLADAVVRALIALRAAAAVRALLALAWRRAAHVAGTEFEPP